MIFHRCDKGVFHNLPSYNNVKKFDQDLLKIIYKHLKSTFISNRIDWVHFLFVSIRADMSPPPSSNLYP